jgi:hypothetical protein
MTQPLWVERSQVPVLPDGWTALRTEDAVVPLSPGKLFSHRNVAEAGTVPVLNQSEAGFLGFHDEAPGVPASIAQPVATFANHTCAMRLMTQPFSCIQNIFPKRGRPGLVETTYFYYDSRGRVGLCGYKGHHPVFRSAYIPVPPLEAQQRIAEILSGYDALIDINRRRIRILDEMARAIHQEWFVDLRFPGHENSSRVPSALGPIPDSWNVKRLDSVATVNGAMLDTRNAPDDVHYLDISSVGRGHIEPATTYRFADAPGRARRLVRHGDILWSCVRPDRRSHAIVINPVPGTVASTGFAVLTPTHVPYPFLYFATTTDDFVSILANSATGAAYPAVTARVFENAALVIPDARVLRSFDQVVSPMADQIGTLQRQSALLRATRDLLLPRLIAGVLTLDTAA